MAMGESPLSNHHPLFHTMMIRLIFQAGHAAGLGQQACAAVYSIVQMAIMSGIFTFSLYKMRQWEFPRIVVLLSVLYFILYPMHAVYALIMWKDIIFSGFILLFFIGLIDIIREKVPQRSPIRLMGRALPDSRWIFFFAASMGMILFKKNGIYIVILSILVMLTMVKVNRKQALVVTLICVVLFGLYKGPVFSSLGVTEGSPREALSVPIQQYARIAKYHKDELSDADKAAVLKYFDVTDLEEISELYSPGFADPVKNRFREAAFSEDKKGFFTGWLRLTSRFPGEAVNAFLSLNFGYWHPIAPGQVFNKSIGEYPEIDILKIYTDSKFPRLHAYLEEHGYYTLGGGPIVNMLFSPGFFFILLLLAITIFIAKRTYRFIAALSPLLLLWLTAILGPINLEYRYVYGLFVSMPVAIGLVINARNMQASNDHPDLSHRGCDNI
jgi:hypothetical protein